MANIPAVQLLLIEQGDGPLPPGSGAAALFRRAFLHGQSFTAAEVRDRYKVSGTMLANLVKPLRELGYQIESTTLDDKQVRHRIVNVGFTPEVDPNRPWPPVAGGGAHTGSTAKIRAALDAGETVDKAWAEAHPGVSFGNAAQLVRANPDKYERVKMGVYRKRKKVVGRPTSNATAAIRDRLEAGEDLTWEWIDQQGFDHSTVHTAVSLMRGKGMDVERLPNNGGYRLGGNGGNLPKKQAADVERLPHEGDNLPGHPMLGENLQVRGASLTDDGTIHIALRNGTEMWVAEVVARHRMADTTP